MKISKKIFEVEEKPMMQPKNKKYFHNLQSKKLHLLVGSKNNFPKIEIYDIQNIANIDSEGRPLKSLFPFYFITMHRNGSSIEFCFWFVVEK